jgi:serine/threonine protein kinase
MASAPPGNLAAMGALVPGAMVTGSIRLTRMLGRGGMGSVWVAEHLRLRTEVVVKFVAPEYVASEEALRRFEREATLAAKAKSPHVVQMFDHGISDFGLPYIAMELLVGEDLGKRIERSGRIDPRVFAGWLRQACSGLARAHQKGIVHRDIKPENVFLCDEEGEVLVKVLDFGIAKSDANASDFSGTRTGAVIGTVYYMSPEQAMGARDLDHRADLWALGVVTYFAITGVRPFSGDAIGTVVLAITQGTPPRPSALNPALSPAIDAFMAKALARSPADRFQSAREFADAFAQAALGTAFSSRDSGPPAVSGGERSSSPSPAVPSAAPAASNLGTTTGASVPQLTTSEGRSKGPLVGALLVLALAAAAALYVGFVQRAQHPDAALPAVDVSAANVAVPSAALNPVAVAPMPVAPPHPPPAASAPVVAPMDAAGPAAPVVSVAPLATPAAPGAGRRRPTSPPKAPKAATAPQPARPVAAPPPAPPRAPALATPATGTKKNPLQMKIE